MLTGRAETALNVADFHRIREHACEPEGDPLGILFPLHCHLETVAKVNVNDLASDAVKHQVARMPVT